MNLQTTTADTEHTDPLEAYLAAHLAEGAAVVELVKSLDPDTAGERLQDVRTHLLPGLLADHAALSTLVEVTGTGRGLALAGDASVAGFSPPARVPKETFPPDPLRALQILELVALGIEGTRLLWRTLHYTTQGCESCRDFDFLTLANRAAQQLALVEKWRIETARGLFEQSGLQPAGGCARG